MLMYNLKVSVIIPVYKAEKYLKHCIESILAQTYKNIELLLVDDGSPDSCPEICDKYEKENECVHVIHKENEGAAIAREVGLKQSTGNYVMFVDSDDWIGPEYIESMVSLAKEHKVDAVVSGFEKFKNLKFSIHTPYFKVGYYDKNRLVEEIYPQMLCAKRYYTFGIAPCMWGKLFTGELARKQTQYFLGDITQGEDGCFTYSYLLDCDSIYITDNTMYIYRDNPVSVSHSFNYNVLRETEKLRACIENFAKEKNWNIGSQLDEYIAFMCYNIVCGALRADKQQLKENKHLLNDYVKNNFPTALFENGKFKNTASLKEKVIYRLLEKRHFLIMRIIMQYFK